MSNEDKNRQNESPEPSTEANHTSLFGDAIPETKRKGIRRESLLNAIEKFHENEKQKRTKR